jgi:hypothetical protein
MVKSNRALSLAGLAASAIAALLCSCASLAGGDVTETGNARISGSIVDTLGFGVQNVRVQLLPVAYDPVRDGAPSDSFAAITDESGGFILRTQSSGIYNVEGINPANGDRALISNISVVGRNTVFAPTATIQRPGAIKVFLPSQSLPATGYAYLPGTTRSGRVAGSVSIIDSVPAGYFTALHYVNQTDTSRNRIIKTNFTVIPGSIALITDNQAWGFSRNFFINTTLSGAAVSGTVTNFPLLIRLNAANFPFDQAKSDGGDLRFAKSNGAPLSYEIERWDANTRQADIWVGIDTVFGNDSARSVTMYWGNPAAANESNGGAVFDTSNGFEGVWHLNRKCDDVTNVRNNGTSYGTTDTTGIIGDCKKFDGSDSIKIAGLLGTPTSVTLSAWAQLDTIPGGRYGGDVLSIGDAVLMRMDYSILALGTCGAIHPYGDSVYYNVSTGRFLKQTGWHLITFTVDQNNHSQTFYIDGSAVRTRDSVVSIDYSKVGQNTFIGTHGNGSAEYNFSGRIDEVRTYRKSISADYVKLSFMNQKERDALVKW